MEGTDYIERDEDTNQSEKEEVKWLHLKTHSKGPQEIFCKMFLHSLVASKTEEKRGKSKIDVFLLKANSRKLKIQILKSWATFQQNKWIP